MLPRLVVVLLALALGACTAPASSSSTAPSGGASGSALPGMELGTFDQEALEAKFGTVFTHEDLTESKSRYISDFRLPLGLEFTIHPADQTKRILETSVRLSVSRDPSQVAIERLWFRLMLAHQPDALEWLRQERDDYLAAPGPDVSVRSMFGPVCTGFFAFGSATSATGKATTMGYFVETQDAHVNCHDTPSG
jgi:hypothetical protein